MNKPKERLYGSPGQRVSVFCFPDAVFVGLEKSRYRQSIDKKAGLKLARFIISYFEEK